MEEDTVVDDFANRLRFEFEENDGEFDGDQDWFVNDKQVSERSPSPTKRAQGSTSTISPTKSTAPVPSTSNNKPAPAGVSIVSQDRSPSTVQADEEKNAFTQSTLPTTFLHYFPPLSTQGILVMELGNSEQVTQRGRYSSKFFKIYVPHVHDAQVDYCLYIRKRLIKPKYKFSMREETMIPWTHPNYTAKMTLTNTLQHRTFKLVTPKQAQKIQFDLVQETRKQALTVHFHHQNKGFPFFSRSSSDTEEMEYTSLIQKFINPRTDIKCPKTNNTLFKIEKEGVCTDIFMLDPK